LSSLGKPPGDSLCPSGCGMIRGTEAPRYVVVNGVLFQKHAILFISNILFGYRMIVEEGVSNQTNFDYTKFGQTVNPHMLHQSNPDPFCLTQHSVRCLTLRPPCGLRMCIIFRPSYQQTIRHNRGFTRFRNVASVHLLLMMTLMIYQPQLYYDTGVRSSVVVMRPPQPLSVGSWT